ncbi:hypothetical protein MIND_00745400 [Mycena indigotica]|uniref:Uncharacterized protein n=1 Tax=Mycena indigotica TaxID=2126181 RepID=A0A8H6SP36_9AGAR|nr:uncharacterized protein MIND_00745400 [Mycena indigotica]KAF7301797.1 hypothetical protein MIND_00745400 [Mycena indigotica]
MFTTRRPDSPPPRSPSPEVVLSPLPPPRRTNAQRPTRLSLQSSETRPTSLKPERRLTSMRSCGELRQPPTPRSSIRSVVSAPPTPREPASPTDSEASFRRTHKRTLSFAIPYRSPPPSPAISSPIPPVPAIPDFVLSPTDKKPVLHPLPTRANEVYLPEWEQFPVTPRKPRLSGGASIMSARRAVAAPAPMTCSTFFALHNKSSQTPQPVAAL